MNRLLYFSPIDLNRNFQYLFVYFAYLHGNLAFIYCIVSLQKSFDFIYWL